MAGIPAGAPGAIPTRVGSVPRSLFDAWARRAAGFGLLQPTLIYGGTAWQALWARSPAAQPTGHTPDVGFSQNNESGIERPGAPE